MNIFLVEHFSYESDYVFDIMKTVSNFKESFKALKQNILWILTCENEQDMWKATVNSEIVSRQ